jgi:beta-phosphoglucomutase-like phosphatase (HAD superfamily)
VGKAGKYPSSKARSERRQQKSLHQAELNNARLKKAVEEEKAMIPGINPLIDKLSYNGYNIHFRVGTHTSPSVIPWDHNMLGIKEALGDQIPNVMQVVMRFQSTIGYACVLLKVTDDAGVVLWEEGRE